MQPRSTRRVIAIAFLLVVASAFAALGFRYWYQPTYDFVEVDDGQVTGYLTRVAAPAGGQIQQLYVNVGDEVKANDGLATLQVIATAPSASLAGPSVTRLLTRVTAPVEGRVAARTVSVGDTVSPGQALVTIANLKELWVVANIDEGRIRQIALNQSVDVTIGALGKTFAGRLTDIGSATTDLASPAVSAGLTSSDSTKKIPVQIQVDWKGAQPLPGMTAVVVIHVK